MTNQPMKQSEMITEAINAHGIFFKRAVRSTLEQMSGVTILGEEYPVRYLEGASLDLLVGFTARACNYVLPVECKRAYVANKRWIFFQDPVGQTRLVYHFHGKELNVSEATLLCAPGTAVCVEGVEVNLLDLQENTRNLYKAAKPDSIWKAAFQACKGSHGFIMRELTERTRVSDLLSCSDFRVFPLIITTAPLSVCDLATQNVDVLTGNHQDALATRDVPWLILSFPFTPESTLGRQYLMVQVDSYVEPKMQGFNSKEGIVVLNAGHLSDFFTMLRNIG